MVYHTEEEQIENIKRWWKQYGNYLFYGLVLIFLVYSGTQWFSQRNKTLREHSSSLYTRALEGFLTKKDEDFFGNANKLLEDFPKTLYADFARLFLAKKSLADKNIDKSIGYLKEISNNSSYTDLKDIANLRLARIYNSKGDKDLALESLNKLSNPEFDTVAHEIRGDVYLSKKDYEKAREAYTLASEHLKKLNGSNFILQYKLDNLPTTSIKNKKSLKKV